jgi:hypothetical protein
MGVTRSRWSPPEPNLFVRFQALDEARHPKIDVCSWHIAVSPRAREFSSGAGEGRTFLRRSSSRILENDLTNYGRMRHANWMGGSHGFWRAREGRSALLGGG